MKYYGNYLGLCVNNDDPEKRGRVQVLIPHIMPSLFEDWNEAEEDIKILGIGDNIPNSINSKTLEKLMKILPWAESALPIIGTCAPGNLVTNAGGGSFYNESPVPDPIGGGDISGVSQGGTNNNWAGSLPKLNSLLPPGNWNPSSQKRDRQSTRSGLTSDHYIGNTSAYAIDLGLNSSFNGNSQAATTTALQIVNNTQSQLGRPAYTSWSQIPNGNYVATTPDGYRVQVIWQSMVGGNHYDHIHFGVKNVGGGNFDPGAPDFGPPQTARGGLQSTSTGGQLPAASPLQSTVPTGQDPNAFNYGSAADPRVNSNGISLGGANLSLTQSHKQGLQSFLQNYQQNTNQYTAVSQQLRQQGVNITPSQVAALHWREASGDFTKSIANGQSLGTYIRRDGLLGNGSPGNSFSLTNSWTANAVEVLAYKVTEKYGGPRDISSSSAFNDFAERFNGLGYRQRGVTSPYVFAGTNLYTGGKFIADGVYSSETFDQQVGTAVLAAAADGSLQDLDLNATSPGTNLPFQIPTGLVQNPDPHGTTTVLDMNNMAAGAFSYPAAGAMLWCFFREGNPLFPVYFAASYGQAEWSSAYRYPVGPRGAEPGPGYKPSAADGNPVTSVGGVIKLGGVGAIRWEDTTVPDDPTKDQKSLMIASHDGSNIFFNEGYSQYFSQFDRRDQVDGDRWEVTMGQKEEWVQGSLNRVIVGDYTKIIGNAGPTAVAAAKEIRESLRRSFKPLEEPKNMCKDSGGTTTPGGGSTTGGSATAPESGTEAPKTFGSGTSIPVVPLDDRNPNFGQGLSVGPASLQNGTRQTLTQEQIAQLNAIVTEANNNPNYTEQQRAQISAQAAEIRLRYGSG